MIQDKMTRPSPISNASIRFAGSVRLKVTPAELKSKAETVTQEINRMKTAFNEMENIIARTSHYWIGDAGDCHRRLYQKDKEDIEVMLRYLREHPIDLLKMANIYEEAEEKVREMSEVLPGDIIS